jgi:hypothetical protein
MPISSQARSVAGMTGSISSIRTSQQQKRSLEDVKYAYVGPVTDTGRTAKDVKKVEKSKSYHIRH